MNTMRLAGGILLLLFGAFGLASAQDSVNYNVPDGVDVQLRGPVHEAFAQAFDVRAEPGQVVAAEPPPPVPEEPPEERPDGADVQFIPGYWAWDAESSRFLWVSGVYRHVPTGRQWVPGQWVNTPDGWRWAAGFWASDQEQVVQYTPEPPAPLQTEPDVAPPSDDAAWMPGLWAYQEQRFVWRPGYWTAFRPGRLWVPARYYWTPRGYVFVSGYWDYPLEERGLLFAPVVFSRPLWTTPGWSWRPTLAINLGLVYDSCFVRPGGAHLYYGDYYGSHYAGLGFRPWYSGAGRYDPTFTYHYDRGQDRQWLAGQERRYRDRGEGRLAAPPRTLIQQQTIITNTRVTNATSNNVRVVAPPRVLQTENRNLRLVKTTPAEVAVQRAQIERTRTIAQTRAKLDSGARIASATPTALQLPPPVLGTAPTRTPSNHTVVGPQPRVIPTPPTTLGPSTTPRVTPTPHANPTPAAPLTPRIIQTPPTTAAPSPTPRATPTPHVNPTPAAPLTPRIIQTPPTTAVPSPTPRATPTPHVNPTPAAPLTPRVIQAPSTTPAPSPTPRVTPTMHVHTTPAAPVTPRVMQTPPATPTPRAVAPPHVSAAPATSRAVAAPVVAPRAAPASTLRAAPAPASAPRVAQTPRSAPAQNASAVRAAPTPRTAPAAHATPAPRSTNNGKR
jgi:hypothetical protein